MLKASNRTPFPSSPQKPMTSGGWSEPTRGALSKLPRLVAECGCVGASQTLGGLVCGSITCVWGWEGGGRGGHTVGTSGAKKKTENDDRAEHESTPRSRARLSGSGGFRCGDVVEASAPTYPSQSDGSLDQAGLEV